MHKVLLLGTLLTCTWLSQAATSIDQSLQAIEANWAKIYYSVPAELQSADYVKLLSQTKKLAKANPKRAEPLIWQAIIVATNAESLNGLAALDALQLAHDLLLTAIEINPRAMDGSAFVTLGSLYHMVPGWPIAFGNDDKAQQSLLIALKISPNGIDSNYFYGEYLLSQGQNNKASHYFQRALQAPVRQQQLFADSQLQAQAALGLENATSRKVSGIKNFFTNLLNSTSAKVSH
jgi:tetratricopeptide (TPR) repeat protein